uniref:Uncharacterized protein n=1 Tax=Anopheles coluzzii TaxID=1518534 RepID=A0A8W7Q1E4_ANOCL
MTVGSGIEFGIQQTEKVSQSGIGVCVAATNPHRLPHPVMPPKPAQSGKYGCEFRLRKRPECVNLSGSGLSREGDAKNVFYRPVCTCLVLFSHENLPKIVRTAAQHSVSVQFGGRDLEIPWYAEITKTTRTHLRN